MVSVHIDRHMLVWYIHMHENCESKKLIQYVNNFLCTVPKRKVQSACYKT